MNLIALFAEDTSLMFEKRFGGASAFERALAWARSAPDAAGTAVFAYEARRDETERALAQAGGALPSARAVFADDWDAVSLLRALSEAAREAGADVLVFAFASAPFYDAALTRSLIEHHRKYAAEYTFAEGYAEGVVPAAVDAGALAALAALAEKEAPRADITPRFLFDVLQPRINSFEVEAIIAPHDVRLYRWQFLCGSTLGAAVCSHLYERAAAEGVSGGDALGMLACRSPEALRTVPAFYALQIAEYTPDNPVYSPYAAAYEARFARPPWEAREKSGRAFMPAADVKRLLAEARALSGEAVVSLSAWGEALSHPDIEAIAEAALSYPGFALLIETCGVPVTEALARSLRRIADAAPRRRPAREKIYWIVYVDAVDEACYRTMHPASGAAETPALETALRALDALRAEFGAAVYPQFVRTALNEAQLEAFYRAYKERGNVLIQKYDTFCGRLPDLRPADLSPLERFPCWHLRRDMVILADGGVPMCRECVLDTGGEEYNALAHGVEAVWNRTGKEMPRCGGCDEYYTFNF